MADSSSLHTYRWRSPQRHSLQNAFSMFIICTLSFILLQGIDGDDAVDDSASSGDQLTVKWRSESFEIDVDHDTTVQEVKEELALLTSVPASRQKLLGLTAAGRALENGSLVRSAGVKRAKSVMMIGTPDRDMVDEEALRRDSEIASVINDLEWDYEASQDAANKFLTDRLQQRIKRRIEKIDIHVMNPLRENKKLLVLDLDYTLIDFKSIADGVQSACRPYLHEFLSAVYPYYDICVWSQTSWRWLELKVTEMGMLSHPDYRVAFVVDRSAMFSVVSKIRGTVVKHDVKPLSFLWAKFPQYGERNTVHVDDLSRNFVLNPRNGVKVKAFKRSASQSSRDRELEALSRFLLHIQGAEDVRSCALRDWKEELRRL